MPLYANWNGEMISENAVNISPANRSFRYGDGCFETMKMVKGKLLLYHLHLDRLLSSLWQLKLQMPANFGSKYLQQAIMDLAAANDHLSLARVRLTIYRQGEDNAKPGTDAGFIIQTMVGDGTANQLNNKGFELGIYPHASKSCDVFSSIKSNNYLPYTMARIWANENIFDDSLVCNCFGRIADATIANIFMVENGIIKTPPLTEGCVDGVMRRYLLASFQRDNLPCREEILTPTQLLNAAEVFLSNAITGMRWVRKIGERQYANDMTAMLHSKYIVPLFNPSTI